MYYMIGASVPSLHRESTNSLIGIHCVRVVCMGESVDSLCRDETDTPSVIHFKSLQTF